ncbi:type III secretion protein [Paracidovorax citrulli]|uniref:type III secretion protein n=1 Tax=Paracidovorax citrulli TaxID=80869 RepID=UPI0005FBF40F|nr:type III secretion protein [Paracidovorax citrulli]QCX11136.1 type III secretion protein HrpB7 [Paracidovorax citrulli]UEG45892.1 type III secretion protein [Paracidovorax citrulli]UMT86812.1 type III secretion protein [Paracidovorax citrulli]UMT94853.1 type III secretion protein [Paracidovorax citrulli]WIY34347.1 type III secretion protein [Paracidovorax citrulli]
MSTIKGLRTLVRLKARRTEQAEADLQESIQALKGEEDALAHAQAEEAQVREAERARRERLASATSAGSRFLANDAITLQMLVSEAQGRSAEAGRHTEQAQARVEAAREQVRLREGAVRRAQRQLEATRERLEQALAAAERAQEDAQDEEAEETAVARMLAAARQGRRTGARSGVARAVEA